MPDSDALAELNILLDISKLVVDVTQPPILASPSTSEDVDTVNKASSNVLGRTKSNTPIVQATASSAIRSSDNVSSTSPH